MAYGSVNVPGRLTAADVGAAAAGHTHTAAQVGARPNTWTPTAAEVGAAAANHTHTAAQVGAAAANHTHNYASPSHTHTAADVGAVPTARKVNGKALSADISLNAADVGARPSTWTPSAADVGAAAADHTHTAADVGAAAANHTHTAAQVGAAAANHTHNYASPSHTHTAADVGAVPTTRTVNGKVLSANISLSAADVGAAAASHIHTAAQVGARPDTWTPTAADVGAAAASHTHTATQVGALPVTGGTLSGNLTLKGSNNYGTKINFGDGDYVHISEPTDDCMEIKAKKVNFVLSDTSDSKFTVNGSPFGVPPNLSGFVPTTCTVNGKALSANISLNAADVGARPNTWTPTAADVGAAAANHTHTAAQVGAVPTTRTVNGKALSANISLNAADVGAATASAVSQAYDLAMSAITSAQQGVPKTVAIDGITLGGSYASQNIVRYGVCSDGYNVGNRTVAIPGFQLVEGARISVKFDYQCNVCFPTLNVNGTGAKDILVPSRHGTWDNGSIVDFIYDGTRWVIPEGISKLVEQRLERKLERSGGSMTGALYAEDDTSYTSSKVRNISFGTTALTAGSSSLASGAIKLIYE